jgi:hypothetical protein
VEPAVIRRAPRPETGFLLVRNEIVRDDRLSYRARGVLLDILSRPDNWTTSADRMTTGREGREALLTAFRELREVGYMRTSRVQDDKGRWATVTDVFDSPESAEPASVNQPCPHAPETGEPKSVEPTVLRSTEEEELSSGAADAVPGAKRKQDLPRPDVERLCTYLADKIEGNGSLRPTVTAAWRKECRLMLDKDKRTEEQVRWLINWCQNDTFWRGNVMSMPKFRQQFDQMRIKAVAQREKQTPSSAVLAPAPILEGAPWLS